MKYILEITPGFYVEIFSLPFHSCIVLHFLISYNLVFYKLLGILNRSIMIWDSTLRDSGVQVLRKFRQRTLKNLIIYLPVVTISQHFIKLQNKFLSFSLPHQSLFFFFLSKFPFLKLKVFQIREKCIFGIILIVAIVSSLLDLGLGMSSLPICKWVDLDMEAAQCFISFVQYILCFHF